MDAYFIQELFPRHLLYSRTTMPAAPWTTKAQSTWLQEQLPEYMQQSTGNKDYSCFWPAIHKYWFKTWPERNILFPDIPDDVPLTVEQTKQEVKAEQQRKVVSCQLCVFLYCKLNRILVATGNLVPLAGRLVQKESRLEEGADSL